MHRPDTVMLHPAPFVSASISRNGCTITGYKTGKVAVMNQTGEVTVKEVHTKPVLTLEAFHGTNGLTIISASTDTNIAAWNVKTGDLKVYSGHSMPVCSLAIWNQHIVSGSSDATVIVWDNATCQPMKTMKGHDGIVRGVAASDDRIYSCSDDQTIKVWDPNTGECLATLTDHTDKIRAIAVLPENRLVSCSEDRTIKIWDLTDLNCINSFRYSNDCPKSIQVNSNGSFTTYGNKEATTWQLDGSVNAKVMPFQS